MKTAPLICFVVAGPSEVLVLADETADAAVVAADMLAQVSGTLCLIGHAAVTPQLASLSYVDNLAEFTSGSLFSSCLDVSCNSELSPRLLKQHQCRSQHLYQCTVTAFVSLLHSHNITASLWHVYYCMVMTRAWNSSEFYCRLNMTQWPCQSWLLLVKSC